MTRHRGKRHRRNPSPDIRALVHRDLNRWIEDNAKALNWSDRFMELAQTWAAMVARGGHPAGKVSAVEGALMSLSRSAQHRGGFGKLKDAFKEICDRHEAHRGGTVLFGQHRYKRLFPNLYGTQRQRRQLQTSR